MIQYRTILVDRGSETGYSPLPASHPHASHEAATAAIARSVARRTRPGSKYDERVVLDLTALDLTDMDEVEQMLRTDPVIAAFYRLGVHRERQRAGLEAANKAAALAENPDRV